MPEFEKFVLNLEFPYCYYACAVDPGGDVDYLHYGLFEEGTEDAKRAQENLARLMKSLIPKGVRRILDVGCGLGRTTYDLARSGYSVVGISPDIMNMEMARAKYRDDNLELVTVSFENYRASSSFDLLLFQESSQYVPSIKIFSRTRALLSENGYLLIGDEVRYREVGKRTFHRKDLFIQLAAVFGFELVFNRDITDKVLPTRKLLAMRLLEQRDALIEKFRPTRRDVEGELKSLSEGWEEDTRLFEGGQFGYEVFLFKKNNDIVFRIGGFFRLIPSLCGMYAQRNWKKIFPSRIACC
jgi:SAM-dependent methyltransferase